MGATENRHATDVRRRLMMPSNAVPDHGIDLKRQRLESPKPQIIPLPQPKPPEIPPAPPSAAPELPAVPPLISKPLTSARIIDLVARHTGWSVAEILNDDRRTPLVFARHIAIWLCLQYLPRRVSFTQLALIFKKDHTTIIHARDRMRRYSESNSPQGDRLREISQLVAEDIRSLHGNN